VKKYLLWEDDVSIVVTVMTSSIWDAVPCLDKCCYLSPKLHGVTVYIGSEIQVIILVYIVNYVSQIFYVCSAVFF
jgi:hypothetical protein